MCNKEKYIVFQCALIVVYIKLAFEFNRSWGFVNAFTLMFQFHRRVRNDRISCSSGGCGLSSTQFTKKERARRSI